MARAKKTTTAKPKAKAPAVNTTVKKGVDAIVNALNEDYAGVCKRVYEQQITDDSLEARDKAAAQSRLEEIEAGNFEYSRTFTTKKVGKYTRVQYEGDGQVTPVAFVDSKGQVMAAADETTPAKTVAYDVSDEASLSKAVSQADWGGNFVNYPQE